MQYVSDDYINALYNSKLLKSDIFISIVTEAGTLYNFSDADIVTGSLSVNNKSVSGTSFEIGAAYQAELSMSLINDKISTNTLLNAQVFLYEMRYLDNTFTDYEVVHIGTYYVSEATRTKKTLALKALDAMDWLDTEVEEDTSGTVYELLNVIALKTGVAISQGETEIDALPNATRTYYVYADDGYTYRDLAAYLARLTCTFATIEPTYETLVLRQYQTSTTFTVPADNRESTTVSDYKVYYKAVCVNMLYEHSDEDSEDYSYEEYTYIDDDNKGGMLLEVGEIPIVRGSDALKNTIAKTIYNGIKSLKYTPVSFTLLNSDMALELGDLVEIEGEDVCTNITSFTWNYHGSESITGVEDNQRTSGTDSTSKSISELENEVSQKKIVIHTYSNAAELSIYTSEIEIAVLSVIPSKKNTGVFIITVPFTMNCDGVVTFYYYKDGELDKTSTVSQYASRGANIVTLTNYFALAANVEFEVQVKMTTSYFESDIRELTAAVYDTDIDTTIPTATIEALGVKAILITQGKTAAVAEFDGNIEVSDELILSSLSYGNNYVAGAFTDTFGSLKRINPVTATLSDIYTGNITYANNYTISTANYFAYPYIERGYTGLWGAWISETWESASTWTWGEMGANTTETNE